MLSQRSRAVDGSYGFMREWFTLFADIVKSINNSKFIGSGDSFSHTGDTSEVLAKTIPIRMGNNGLARLSLSTSCTANANAKTVTIKLGGTTIQTVTIDSGSSSQFIQITIVGRGASSQYISGSFNNASGSGSGPYSIDMSGSVNIEVTMQLGTSTDTIALETWTLEVERT